MNKKEALNLLAKELKFRNDMIKHGENKAHNQHVVEIIELKMDAIKRMG